MYKPLNDLLKEKVDWMTEHEGFYYVSLVLDRSSNAIWKVDKKSGKASYMQYPLYFEIMDESTPIDSATLRRRA